MALTVVLAGGGTGGHVFPALAVADAITRRDARASVRFVGTERGIESRVVRPAGYPLDVVPARPVLGKGLIAQIGAGFSLIGGAFAALRVLRRVRPDLVIGVGGYVSFPTVVAALLLRIPTALLEVNAVPGLANRVLGRFVREVFTTFEETARWFPKGRVYRTGVPIRSMPKREPRADDGIVRLLVFGGSQGARTINRAITGALDQLGERDGFRITHQTGSLDYDEVRAAYAAAECDAEVAPFFDDLTERMGRADLVVARAGMSSLAEICMSGVASILIPLPQASGHQMANARALERTGAAIVVPNAEAAERLPQVIRDLARDPAARRRMAEAAASRAVPDAADRVSARCESWLATGGPS